MNENYVSEINGYKIKDKEARQDIVDIKSESMDLVNVKNFTLSELTGDTTIITDLYGATLAWNNSNKWFKFFMYFKINVTPSDNDKTIVIPIPSGFTISTEYVISDCTVVYKITGEFIGMTSLIVNPNYISIKIDKNLNGIYVFNALPFLYYNDQIENIASS